MADFSALAQWDTPTICNALEVLEPGRRASGFTTKPFTVIAPEAPPIVGHVRTARIRASSKPASPAEAEARREAYYAYLEDGPRPSVVVIEDLDDEPGFGAFWGEVNSAIHLGLGCLGCVTNGSFRDVADWAEGFQMLGGMLGPSHGFVHVVDFGGPVTVHGMEARDGDLIHADRHGAVAFTADLVAGLPEAVAICQVREAPILEAARAPGFTAQKLQVARTLSAKVGET
ncbi:MAG: RraA family protein [Pseudomonadota bacterium]